MTTTTEYSQDFFIYVPMNNVETLTRINSAREEKPTTEELIGFDPADDNWVKIPLDNKVVVYARLWGDKMLIRSATD